MIRIMKDPTTIIYTIDLIVAIYGIGLFSWWWIKQGRASAVFGYVTFMFVGETVETSLALYARMLMFFDSAEAYTNFLISHWWMTRKIVTVGVLICIVVHMSYRAFYQRFREGK